VTWSKKKVKRNQEKKGRGASLSNKKMRLPPKAQIRNSPFTGKGKKKKDNPLLPKKKERINPTVKKVTIPNTIVDGGSHREKEG